MILMALLVGLNFGKKLSNDLDCIDQNGNVGTGVRG